MRKKLSFLRMACASQNCSGHGECLNGTCFCEIEFEGEECRKTNSSYFVSFACVYFFVAAVCFIQLVLAIVAEWKRMKVPSLTQALKLTNQKVLYVVVCLASLIRASYFTYLDGGVVEGQGWTRSLMSAYYPLLLSGASLIVCFWAELFHLRDTRWEQRQFLSKSSLAFVMFNVITYSLLAAELITVNFLQTTPELERFYAHVFNGCYAVLLLIVVIFFLIYGIEVYFKVRGGFLSDEVLQMKPLEEAAHLFPMRSNGGDKCNITKPRVDISQLHQSRLGLLSQAVMLLAVIVLLCSEIFEHFWKSKVPIYSRNYHNLVFRILEIGVALWFPCVLWNCMRPEQLWILNPKKLLKTEGTRTVPKVSALQESLLERSSAPSNPGDAECWICYDRDRKDAGEMIQPCMCKGDVKMVHHGCLLKWLVESVNKGPHQSTSRPHLKCPVCNCDYNVSCRGRISMGKVMRSQAWMQSIAITFFMLITLGLAVLITNLVSNTLAKVLAVGSACLVIYVSIRFVCQKQIDAYQRAKVSAMSIENNVSTISEAVLLTSKSESSTCHTPTQL